MGLTTTGLASHAPRETWEDGPSDDAALTSSPLPLSDAAAAGAQERRANDDPADKRRPGLPAGFPFSLASEGNGLVFISGMPAPDAGGAFVAGTFEEEADRAWARVVSIAAASGCSLSDFLYVQVLLADIGNYAGINTWWQKQFPDPTKAPARLTFQAGAPPFGAQIELQTVAAVPDPTG